MGTRQIHRRTKPVDDEPDVRIALRVPAEVHEQIRRRAREERLSVNQAIVQAMEKFSGSANAGTRQEIRDLVEICKMLGTELTPQFKVALTERVKAVYGLDLPGDCCGADSIVGRGGEERFVSESR